LAKVTEQTKDIPILARVDVAVVGGGPAGIAASLSAARHGASVLLIERYGFLGGVFSACEVPVLMGFICADRKIVGGIAEEVLSRLAARGALRITDPWTREDLSLEDARASTHYRSSGEEAKRLYDIMIAESSCRLLLHCLMSDAITDDGVVKGVIVETRGGRGAVLADVTIDCTGDGFVASAAGVPYTEDNDTRQAKSLCCRLGNVRHLNIEDVHARIRSDMKSGLFPYPNCHLTNFGPGLGTNEVGMNMTQIGGNSMDPWQATHMEVDLRQQMWAVFVTSGCQMGIRESRHFRTDYVLTESDILDGRSFEDRIGLAGGSYGYHDPKGDDYPWRVGRGNVAAIPYRSLLAEGQDGLLLAGRCMGVESRINDTIRHMPRCMTTGQAAGTAAALAVERSVKVRDVPVPELQSALREDGVLLEPHPLAGK